MRIKVTIPILALAMAALSPAINVAVYADGGSNSVVNYLIGQGDTAYYVNDADIAAGLANSADAFFYTRSQYSFGTTLSAAAAAQITSTFGSAVGLFDDVTDLAGLDATADTLISNAVGYAGAHKGVVGEFNGAGWLVDNGYFSGTSLGPNSTGSYNPHVNLAPSHPVMAGLGATYSYSDGVDYINETSGIPSANVLALDSQGRVSVAVTNAVPEPCSMAALGLGGPHPPAPPPQVGLNGRPSPHRR